MANLRFWCATLSNGFRESHHIMGVLALSFFCSLNAQTPRIVMSPVPIWNPSGGNTAPAAGQAAVFFDSRANQLILLSTDVLGSAAQVRFDVPNATKASVAVSVHPVNAEITSYSYFLSDDPQAFQRSKQFSILLPGSDASLSSGQSGTWQYSSANSGFPDRVSDVNLGTMRWASWRDSNNATSKIAGATFTLQSGLLPGFVDAFVEGQVDNPVTAGALATLSGPLADQAKSFLQPGIGSTGYLVIAPLFPVGTSKDRIAANFHYGLSALQRKGVLSPSSVYANELLQSLSSFLNSGSSLSLPSAAVPNSDLERTIQQSIAISLH